MSDRVDLIRPLMDAGVSYDDALRRVTLADSLHDQGDAVQAAITGVSEYLCNRLDGRYPEDALHPAYKDALGRLMRAWHDYHESVVQASQRLTPAQREHVGSAGGEGV